ncbi:lysozyme inhibitor LprI family protein [Agrobacterium vitis]|uniref:lysozyme inhibitor LprI family protein n=1 Tax=Agrobacterium vitis TaxID=373 RepID=UPI0008727971|nr:lysozyme inhibitor LprI family protein [Agrobacterium vitis]
MTFKRTLPLLLCMVLLCITAVVTPAAHAETIGGCSGPGNGGTGDDLLAAIAKTKSCKAAAALYNGCTWGSSADTAFAAAAVQKCEADFVSKLNKSEMTNYADRMQLCAYQYSMTSGTLYMSMAASCQVGIAEQFSTNPKLARTPLPKTSFDCAKAQAPLERSICASPALGRADLVLNNSFRDEMRSAQTADEKRHVTERQKAWLDRVAVRCKPDGSAKPELVDCLRSAFEARFTAINQCSEAGDAECVDASEAEEATAAVPAPRASFNCDAPKTPLEVVICVDVDLGKADIKLSEAYKSALAGAPDAQRDVLINSQRAWLSFVQSTCPLGVVGGVPPVQARACVRSAFVRRAEDLSHCVTDSGGDGNCLWHFDVMPKKADNAPPVPPRRVHLVPVQ